jgi:PilZ domain
MILTRRIPPQLELCSYRGTPDKKIMISPNSLFEDGMENVFVRKPILLGRFRMPESMHPREGDAAPIEREKRCCKRVPVQVSVFCRSNQGEDELFWSAQVVDISRGGMQLFSRRKFDPTTIVRICISEDSGISSEFLEAVVVRAQQSPEEGWILGCTLVKDLSEAELQIWLQRNCMNSNGEHQPGPGSQKLRARST